LIESRAVSAGLVHVATYRRRVAASTERVWENVLDWEHLPHLHAASFRSIALDAKSASGWRARVGLHPASEIDLELAIEPNAPRYVSRTLAGPGAGSEIWTSVAGVAADATDIEVEFWLPAVAPDRVGAVGAFYTELYRRLWDEDEAMMVRRARELADAATATPFERTPLGHLDDLRAKLPHCFTWSGRRWRLVELDGVLHAHATRCPHWLGPLDAAPVEAGVVTCPWHGWRFDVRSGAALDGRRGRLAAPPQIEIDAAGDVWVARSLRSAAGGA
jgi:nitrite reductase/ring-hydroxylating ferredoxin subunit